MAPTDPLPLSSLLAAYYGKGSYCCECIDFTKQSLKLLGDGASPLSKMLHNRLANAYIHTKQFAEAQHILPRALDTERAHEMSLLLDRIPSLPENFHNRRPTVLRLIKDLPRYKAGLQPVHEYYLFGHDQFKPLYDEQLAKTTSPTARLRLRFGGYGNARHVYSTIVAGGMRCCNASPQQNLRLGLNDVNPLPPARFLVILLMLYDRSTSFNGDPSVLLNSSRDELTDGIVYTSLRPYCRPKHTKDSRTPFAMPSICSNHLTLPLSTHSACLISKSARGELIRIFHSW